MKLNAVKYDVEGDRASKIRTFSMKGYHAKWCRRELDVNLSGLIQQMLDQMMHATGHLPSEEIDQARKHYRKSRFQIIVLLDGKPFITPNNLACYPSIMATKSVEVDR